MVNASVFANQILRAATLRGGIFNGEELVSIIKECDKADFNDIYFARFCAKEEAVLITHDFDFKAIGSSSRIYTANQKYLT